MDSINVSELVERLGSDEDAVRKMAVFKLQSNIGDPSFADVFILEGGLAKLRYLALHATGNTLAYSLTSFSRLLEVDKGWDYVNQDLVERVVLLLVLLVLLLTISAGGRACCHPSTGQYSPRCDVNPCLHRFTSLHKYKPTPRIRLLWFSCFEARHRRTPSVFGDAR